MRGLIKSMKTWITDAWRGLPSSAQRGPSEAIFLGAGLLICVEIINNFANIMYEHNEPVTQSLIYSWNKFIKIYKFNWQAWVPGIQSFILPWAQCSQEGGAFFLTDNFSPLPARVWEPESRMDEFVGWARESGQTSVAVRCLLDNLVKTVLDGRIAGRHNRFLDHSFN